MFGKRASNPTGIREYSDLTWSRGRDRGSDAAWCKHRAMFQVCTYQLQYFVSHIHKKLGRLSGHDLVHTSNKLEGLRLALIAFFGHVGGGVRGL
jgi:hypothetical protein